MFMSKVAIVYWSGTGNTEAMAAFVAEGAKGKGADAVLLTSSEFDVSMMDSYDAVAGRIRSMCGVIVVDVGRSRSTCHGRDAYIHDHA